MGNANIGDLGSTAETKILPPEDSGPFVGVAAGHRAGLNAKANAFGHRTRSPIADMGLPMNQLGAQPGWRRRQSPPARSPERLCHQAAAAIICGQPVSTSDRIAFLTMQSDPSDRNFGVQV